MRCILRQTPEPVFSAYARKFGGAEQAEGIITRLNAVAASEGIDMRLDRALRTNTFDARRDLSISRLRYHRSSGLRLE
ncbi:MAG: hypothetical protein EXQ69_05030 [Acidimicrobiia bacterium]|nr:hypothetical protein [Acidimicrobiia bacterium]